MTRLIRSRLALVLTALFIVAATEALELSARSSLWQDTGLPLTVGAVCTEAAKALVGNVPGFLWAIGLALVLAIAAVASASVAKQAFGIKRITAALRHIELTRPNEDLEQAIAQAGVTCRVRIAESTDFAAFCIGLRSPEVWLSTAVLERLSGDELEAVLRHEACHARRRDPVKLLIANAARAALFVLPPIRDSAHNYMIERELDADAATIHEMENALPLASALYKAIDAKQAFQQAPLAVGAFTAIDARIEHLVCNAQGEPAPSRANAVGFFLAALGTVAVSAAACVLALNV